MAIHPAYGQFPRRPLPIISKGQESSNIALVALREQEEILAQEKAKLATVPVVPTAPKPAVAPIPPGVIGTTGTTNLSQI